MWPLRKCVIVVADVACTVLTLLTGFQENPVLVALTGRYDHVRARLQHGSINYGIARLDTVDRLALLDLADVGASFRFVAAPTRSPANVGEDRSTCMRVNSINASVLAIQYDDVFGRGARRQQVFLHSISAPNCRVINFQPQWLDRCVETTFGGNRTACYAFILDNFDALMKDRQIQVGTAQDFGTPGQPLLKCLGRPAASFEYITDLLVFHSYWAGGGFHVEVQSSTCRAASLAHDAIWQWGLFATDAVDQSATVVSAVEQHPWFAYWLPNLTGAATLVMTLRGIFIAFSQTNFVHYVPSFARTKVLSVVQLPFVALAVHAVPPRKKTDIVVCRSKRSFTSDRWMNHWLYILLSILDALVNIRLMYIVLGTGSWMLNKQQNFENFLFVCSALARLTWLTCFAHTLLRYSAKAGLQMIKSTRNAARASKIDTIGAYVDACALFMSFKAYSIFLAIYLYTLLMARGTTTLMVRAAASKTPVYGGLPQTANFWHSEIVCDVVVTCAIMLAVGHAVSACLLCTRYRRVASNRLVRLLQNRRVFVSWDVFMTLEALGIDPHNAALECDGVAATNCSFGSLLQQLYASGPSGLVEFAGDAIFSFFSASSLLGAPPTRRGSSLSMPTHLGVLRYLPEDARSMGLLKPHLGREVSPSSLDDDWGQRMLSQPASPHPSLKPSGLAKSLSAALMQIHPTPAQRSLASARGLTQRSTLWRTVAVTSPRTESGSPPATRFADRVLSVHAEWTWGRIVLVDRREAPGEFVRAGDGSALEFAVQDALALLQASDVKDLLDLAPVLHIT